MFFQISFLSCSIFTFRARISYSFVFTFNMALQRTCSSCCKLTLRARISDSFVFTFNMSLQSTCCSCGKLTFKARISYSFVFTFNMALQNTCCSCGKLTLRAGISDSFMFTFNMIFQIFQNFFGIILLYDSYQSLFTDFLHFFISAFTAVFSFLGILSLTKELIPILIFCYLN